MSLRVKTETGDIIVADVGGGGGGASTAEEVSYDNTASGLIADNVQDAIDVMKDEFYAEIDHVNTSIAGKISTPEMAEGESARIGQVLAVKTVDDEGKPTEWQTAPNGDMPVYTLAEYEEVKDTIPAGTKFAISDDEGGDDPTPTPSGNDFMQWFVWDSTHAISYDLSSHSGYGMCIGSWYGGSNAYTIGGFFVDSGKFRFSLSNGTGMTASGSGNTYSGNILVGFTKDYVEKYNIKQL